MWGTLIASYGTAVAFAMRYLYPGKRAPRTRSIFIARLDDLPDGDTRVVEDLRGARVQVVRQKDRVLALSMVCPHLGCQVHWEKEQQRFQCPCHRASFDAEGRVLFGPPPRGLDRYEVELKSGAVYLKLLEPSRS
jgi:cytochrome b6-f complex iron-sulfur subunit